MLKLQTYLCSLSGPKCDLTGTGYVVLAWCGGYEVRQPRGTPHHGTVGYVRARSQHLHLNNPSILVKIITPLGKVHQRLCGQTNPDIKESHPDIKE